MHRAQAIIVTVACSVGVVIAAPSANRTQPRSLTPDAIRIDLEYLKNIWGPMDRSFNSARRAEFDAYVSGLENRTHSLSPADFELDVSRAVAISRNGHTESSTGRYTHSLPIRMWWFSDGLYVVRAQPDLARLVGAKVERIGQFSPGQLLEKIAPYISGTDAHIRSLSPAYMQCIELLQLIGAARGDGSVAFTMRLRSGEAVNISLRRATMSDPDPFHEYYGAVLQAPAAPGRWPEVLDRVAEVPPSFQGATPLATKWLESDHGILYIRSNRILEGKPGEYRLYDQLAGVLNEVAAWRPHSVIVDLRFNSGGDFFNTIVFAEALPRLIPRRGRVIVLVGPDTFSAAIVTAALLKEGGDRVMIAGEPMGDNAAFWAEGRPVILPNSGISVRPATMFEDWANGCRDRSRCYWPNVVLMYKRISLRPTIRQSMSFADYAAGQDRLLQAAIRLGAERQSQ
jgi:hypothetical protein